MDAKKVGHLARHCRRDSTSWTRCRGSRCAKRRAASRCLTNDIYSAPGGRAVAGSRRSCSSSEPSSCGASPRLVRATGLSVSGNGIEEPLG